MTQPTKEDTIKPKSQLIKTGGFGKYNIHKGQVWTTNNFGDVVVLSVESALNIEVLFLKTNNKKVVASSSLVRGRVKDKLFGVGFNSSGHYKSRTIAYDYWSTMIMRAYSEGYSRKHPTYLEVGVCEEWLDYQNFAEWFNGQTYFKRGYELDKDLLKVGNKIYSPEFCCLVPHEINSGIGIKKGQKGYNYHKRDDCYEGSYRGEYLGRGDKEALIEAYITRRNTYVNGLSLKYEGVLPENVLSSISNYKVGLVGDNIERLL